VLVSGREITFLTTAAKLNFSAASCDLAASRCVELAIGRFPSCQTTILTCDKRDIGTLTFDFKGITQPDVWKLRWALKTGQVAKRESCPYNGVEPKG
jgi:hypothetical protein